MDIVSLQTPSHNGISPGSMLESPAFIMMYLTLPTPLITVYVGRKRTFNSEGEKGTDSPCRLFVKWYHYPMVKRVEDRDRHNKLCESEREGEGGRGEGEEERERGGGGARAPSVT